MDEVTVCAQLQGFKVVTRSGGQGKKRSDGGRGDVGSLLFSLCEASVMRKCALLFYSLAIKLDYIEL